MVWRLDEHNRAASQEQQPEFADARLLREQLDEAAGRPAASGSWPSVRMPRIDAAATRAGQLPIMRNTMNVCDDNLGKSPLYGPA
ncbi:hypothetical protein WT05_03725 [Burkholderia stagnalis]|nr:hypothetical protein WT05_03725 [Burkholderia stagnalis]